MNNRWRPAFREGPREGLRVQSIGSAGYGVGALRGASLSR